MDGSEGDRLSQTVHMKVEGLKSGRSRVEVDGPKMAHFLVGSDRLNKKKMRRC